MHDYFYNGQVRLDWDFDNPNVTGSLIALIMLAVWMLAYLPRGWGKAGFWIALATNAVLGAFLSQTFSRGAAVAGLIGAAILVVYAPRPWQGGRLIAVLILSTGLTVYAFRLGFTERTLHGLSGEDRSITNRWLIYKVIPRMTWDAPEGWGRERSAEAFRQWYQPIGRSETYGRLVNSHATWLVEWPWFLRVIYGLTWFALIVVCVPPKRINFSPPLAVWVSFGVAACFSTVAHHWQLWVVPCMSLVSLLILRVCWKSWPQRENWKRAGYAWTFLGLSWWGVALCTPSQVTLCDGEVTIRGRNHPRTNVFVLGTDEAVMGKFYGHRIRAKCVVEPLLVRIQWAPRPPMLRSADLVILAGKVPGEFEVYHKDDLVQVKRWLLLNPELPSASLLKVLDALKPPTINVKLGVFLAGANRSFWRSLALKHPKEIVVEDVDGNGRFLGQWADYMLLD